MTSAACCVLLVCGAAFGQTAPENAAGDALKNRIRSMNILNAITPLRASDVLPVLRERPKVCATPLLRARSIATGDAMRVIKPGASAGMTSRDEMARVPAPACDDPVALPK